MAERPPLILFILLFILLTIPQGGDGTHTEQQRATLTRFQNSLKSTRNALLDSQYWSGYGNITGFLLSYDDVVNGRNEADWPVHHFSPEHPFVEDEKYSILPNQVSSRVKEFWGIEKAGSTDTSAYLFNISGWAEGEFQLQPNKLVKMPLKLPQYLMDYYKSAVEDLPYDDGDDTQVLKQGMKQEHTQQETSADTVLPSKVGDIDFEDGKIEFSFKNLDYNYKEPDMAQFVYTDDDRVENAVMVEVDMTVNNQEESAFNTINTLGVYFQDTGSILTSSRSGKFLSTMALPHLAFNEDNFNKSKILLTQFSNNTNAAKQVTMDNMNKFITESITNCEFINFIQLAKTEFASSELRAIDEELKNPTGRPITNRIPKVTIKEFLSYSPDCGVMIHKKPDVKLAGEKIEVALRQWKKMSIIFLALILCQLYVLVKQFKVIRTPGQYSVVSETSMFIILYADAVAALTLFYLSLLIETLFLLMVVVSSILYVMCILETQFLTHIRITQANERGTTWWEIMRGSTGNPTSTQPSPEEGLPLPATDPNNTNRPTLPGGLTPAAAPATPAPAIVTPTPTAEQDANVGMSIVIFLMFAAIVTTFFIAQSFMWRRSHRQAFAYISLTIINSYWLPQFFRNTLKNRRCVFDWNFMLALSAIRLFPVNLLFLIPNLRVKEKHVFFVVFLDCWVGLQLFLIFLQGRINPRFWINENWLSKAYNYHPILSMEDLEKGFSSEFLENMNLDDDNADENMVHSKIDCTICMTQIDIPILKNKKVKTKVNTKDYMITPCYHAFHTECLTSWANYKLQCPICRTGLPPV